MVGIQEDTIFVAKLAKYGLVRPRRCGQEDVHERSDPERTELDDASRRIGASQIEELRRVPRHRSSGKWLAQ
jgi:hypothetical protein